VTRFFLFLFIQFFIGGFALAQNNDSVPPKKPDSLPVIQVPQKKIDSVHSNRPPRKKPDSLHVVHAALPKDSLVKKDTTAAVAMDSGWLQAARAYAGYVPPLKDRKANPFFDFNSQRVFIRSDIKEFHGKETMFYVMVSVLLLFAFLRYTFPKYIADLFRVTFRTTMKQRQLGEQLIQTPLPSLILNLFFVITAGLYIDFVLQHYQLGQEYGFWLLFTWCLLGLAAIYIAKFLSLKFFGWLFNISDTTNAYIFTVFLINKMIGVFLVPVLILLAFTGPGIYQASLFLSFCGVFGLLAYRLILAYGLVRNQIKVNPFHFVLYLLAFEIAPLLLIYKLLLRWF
jgi:hypothetical protein